MNKVSSLYIHFPFCRHLCNYCDFFKSAPSDKERREKLLHYHQYLEDSYLELNKLMSSNKLSWSPLETLYIGGGTPSLWGEEGALYLKDFLSRKKIFLADNCESTLEVNPGGWTEETLSGFSDAGFNRFSLGVQSTKEFFLKKLDRIHGEDETFKTLEKFKQMDVNFSVDFMLGLPFSESHKRDILAELKEILSFKPNHLSLYILTVKENYKYYKELPNEDWIANEYLEVSSFLRNKGFDHYEVSNFSLPGMESKHNSKYWNSSSIAALGPSATGYFSPIKTRFKWKTLRPVFEKEVLSDDELLMEKFYLSLRTSKGVDLASFSLGEDRDKILSLAKDWERRKLVILDNSPLVLTAEGFLSLDGLMGEVFNRTETI